MARLRFSPALGFLTLAILAAFTLAVSRSGAPPAAAQEPAPADAAQETFFTALEKDVTQGALRFPGKDGQVVECPLKHTDVKAQVSGFIARVNVTQTFHNPTDEKIEAVYVFPLPHESAVDNMTMVVGDRKIVGIIKRRDEARRIYEQAIAQGQTAALLEQERPNIFTQSVGNIAPGQEVKIEISYVDSLRYDMGSYEFSFPMVVGPRYIPGGPTSSPEPRAAELQGKVSPPVANTDRVPDASRISPPVLKPGVRNGHDIRLTVSLDAGVPVQNLTIPNHQADVQRDGESQAEVTLSPADSLPNKDFVLRYDVVGEKPALAVLSHTGKYTGDAAKLGEGYFMLMVQPKEDERLKKSPPREIVFLCDVSGSMNGQPTAKVQEAMDQMLKLCREIDTVQVITFAGQANKLFEKPVPVTKENIKMAVNFTQGFEGSGGTEMLKGVQMAIDEPVDKERVRIIVMLTDGYIGNEAEIIEHVGKNCGDRVRFWAIGIGSSPNMFLIDGVARQGGGMGKKLGLEDDAVALSQEAMTRIQRAQLANVKIDWGKLQVAETYPARIPELWAGRPIIVYGRYQDGGSDTITVRGDVEGEAAEWPVEVTLAKEEPQHDVLAKVWARQKIEDLMQQDFYQGSPAIEETVTALALDYGLMSQYTSFVAVDAQSETTSDAARPPRRMLVPVPLPEGTRWEGFFGELDNSKELAEVERLERLSQRRSVAFSIDGLGLNTFARNQPMPAQFRFRGAMPGQQAAQHWHYQSTSRLQALEKRQSGSVGYGASGPAPRAYELSTSGRFAGGIAAGRGGGFGGAAFDAGYESYGAGSARLGRAMLGEALYAETKPADALKKDGASMVDFEATGAAIAGQASELAQQAATALEKGRELKKEDKLNQARASLLKAYFLDAAAANFGQSAGQTASAALAAIEEMRQAEIDAWTKELPALEKRLAVVIRDQSLVAALQAIAKKAGVTLRVVEGSLDDAAEMLHEPEPRISFLDLRGATLAQALDWSLQPARLEWTVRNDEILVRSARRSPSAAAWVYDVSTLALPSPKELGEDQDYQKQLEAAKREADAFLSVVRSKLRSATVEWYAPGQLLVLGTAQTHGQAADLIDALADPRIAIGLDGDGAKLRAKTVQRAKDRQDAVAKAAEMKRRLDVVTAHDAFAWKLLAAAADGRLDLEALTELQIAWKAPDMQKLLEAKSPGLLFRSWWAVAESARALPKEKELQVLAARAAESAQPAAERVLKMLQENPADVQAGLAVLYAALAMDAGADFRAQASESLAAMKGDDPGLASLQTVAAALLSEKADESALVGLVNNGVNGEDLAALTALACRRAGGEAWDTFRRQQRDILGKQPLPGDVVVLVNRLAAAWLPLASR